MCRLASINKMRPKSVSKGALALGFVLTLLQLGIAIKVAPDARIAQAYQRLCTWDCHWYESIALNGYRSTVPPTRQDSNLSNVAFFPAYPYMGRALYQALGIQPKVGLLIVAQVFCILFWACLWTCLRQLKIPTRYAVLVVLVVLAHPASFFLISGYSESLFLSSLLFFILVGTRQTAILAGLTLSATRIVGVLAAVHPIVRSLTYSLKRRRLPTQKETCSVLFRALAALSGTALFLIYCKVRFGRFDLYLETQRIGWNIVPDYSAILKWKSFRYIFPIDEFSTRATMVSFSVFAMVETILLGFEKPTCIERRLPLYVAAFAIFFITLSGLKSVHFMSMIRYSLPWYILLTLCTAHLLRQLPRPTRTVEVSTYILAVSVCVVLILHFQIPALRGFLNGRWFA